MIGKDERDLELLIGSSVPIIAIETHEESRAMALLARCARRRSLPLLRWSLTGGLQDPNASSARPKTQDPAEALRAVSRDLQASVIAWLDLHPFLSNPLIVRRMKEIAADYDRIARTQVLLGHQAVIPPEIEKLTVRFALSLPDKDTILALVKAEVAAWQRRNGGAELKGEREVLDLMVRHLAGLTEVDVRRLVRHAFDDDGLLQRDDLARLVEQKHAMLARDSVLSLEIETARFADVAGLKRLKAWVERRRAAFLDEADAGALDVPKGIMLLGVQGCGKSLAAKAVAGTWGVPLMRLDMGALYDKFLGETERNLREALKAADAMAPCVLWIDELEKGVATGGTTSDGGESRRLLGTLLTWMAERKTRVFIVATSNDIEALPPELVRKGRLDEIFFVDLPDASSREEIFRIHLKRRGVDNAAFDLGALAARSEGFSGAEIEQAVIAAMYEANANKVALAPIHIENEIGRTRPLSVVMAERIAYLRAWARGRTVMADD